MRMGKGRRLTVRGLSRRAWRGWVEFAGLRIPCVLGRGGVRARKREGDGATPAGTWELRQMLWRADRGRRPETGLPARPMAGSDGWCDAPADRNYNRSIRHPYPASAERLWRDDRLYDVVVILDYNECPRIRGRGSAIFLHVAKPDRGPTDGCIAMAEADLRKLLARIPRGTRMVIGG